MQAFWQSSEVLQQALSPPSPLFFPEEPGVQVPGVDVVVVYGSGSLGNGSGGLGVDRSDTDTNRK